MGLHDGERRPALGERDGVDGGNGARIQRHPEPLLKLGLGHLPSLSLY
jgi:hypothetical protein